MTREEAKSACDETKGAYKSSIVAIRSRVEQRILQNYLYHQLHITEGVWLEAIRENNSSPFKWEDGSYLVYKNWDINRPSGDEESNCAQFDPKTTRWTDISCARKGLVVCQKLQMWTFPELQNEFFEWRQNFEERFEQMFEEIDHKLERIELLEDSLNKLSDKYKDLAQSFDRIDKDVGDRIEKAVKKLEDNSEKTNQRIEALEDKTDRLAEGLVELHKECSAGCSADSGGADSDKTDIENLRKELIEEINDKVKPIKEKVDESVTDARLEIISWRRTLQIEKKGKWISLGHV